MSSLKESSIWDSLFVFGGAALRGNQELDLRCLRAIANLYRTLVADLRCLLTHRKSISYSCRLRAHLCSLGPRLRLRNSHVSAEQSVTQAKRLSATFGLKCLIVHRTAMPSRSVELCVVALRGNRGPGCATCSRSPWLRQGW